ncbi:MAG: hypothetical protein AAF441_13995 [Pseudomonadota bacterium]
MFRVLAPGLTAALFLLQAGSGAIAGDSNSFLDQFRYDPKFDKPKYQRYKQRSRKLNNFGESSSAFGSNNGSGLYFESERISQPGNIGLKREDQKTQIKLKIQF